MAFTYTRIVKIFVFFLFVGVMLLGRLFYLQSVEGSRLALYGLSGRIQEVPVEAGRGNILDCNGIPMTNISQYFAIVIFPAQVADLKKTAESLALLNCGDAESIADRITKEGRPFKLKSGADAVTAGRINRERLPGVLAVAERVRYGHNFPAAHVIGYINSADNKGVSGIEQLYEKTLHGAQPVFLAALVDAGQRVIPGLGYKRLRLDDRQEPGNVVLTVDSRVQGITERVMDQYVNKGAVVVMRPSTGEILAMASRPNFDANNVGEYLQANTSPLFNRAISAYQPGSVFKLLVAAAALEENLVHPNDVFFDKGYIDVDNLRFKGWDYERGGRGRITFHEALAYSSNPVFIEVGQKLGAKRLIRYAQAIGFGENTGLGFVGEAEGNLPAAANIYLGDLANLSIGQGMLEASPLQIACMVATIVNDGIKVNPSIVLRVTSSAGTTIKSRVPTKGQSVFSPRTAAIMREMMTEATLSGTGRDAYVEKGGSAGKTGTAETGRYSYDGKSINHAWFAGYAPLDNPQVVVVVFVEDGMSGGDIAAPIFRMIVSRIFSQDHS